MRKLLLAGAAGYALLAAAPAGAADLGAAPVPVAVAPAFTWTGWYVGANAGGAWKTGRVDPVCWTPGGVFFGAGCTVTPRVNEGGDGGWFAGGQIGFNWQSGPWVVGIETDFQGADIRSRNTVFGPFAIVGGGTTAPGTTYTVRERIDWFGTTRARVGFTPAERLLVYATGGFAYGEVKVDHALASPDTGVGYFSSNSVVRGGWTIGGGLEYAITNNVSLRAEALYFDLGSTTIQSGNQTPVPGSTGLLRGAHFENQGALVRGAINIKSDGLFGWRLW